MALNIRLEPYTLVSILGCTNYLADYKAVDEKGDEFVITEFNPAYMVTRQDDGTLEVTERFIKEYAADLDEFVRRANVLADIRESVFTPVEAVVEANNTAYAIRRLSPLVTVETYMRGSTMDFDEAYNFIHPLILCLIKAEESGVNFNFSPENLRVSPYRQLVLDSMFSWEPGFGDSLYGLMKLYYRLVTAQDPTAETLRPSAHEVSVPARIDAIVSEILTGDVLYGSLSDFHKKFKSIIDLETAPVVDNAEKIARILRVVASALAVMFIVSLAGLAFGFVSAYRAATFWADPSIFASSDIVPAGRDFSSLALTHPRDLSDPIEGTIVSHGGFLFYRVDSNGPALARRLTSPLVLLPGITGMIGAEEETVILSQTRPSFIVGVGDYIYFTDGLSGYAIYRAELDGGGLLRVSDNAALHLIYLDGFLYYANADNNGFLYRIHLSSGQDEFFLAMPISGVVTDGERLFFSSIDDFAGIYALDPASGTVQGLIGGVSRNLKYVNDTLFFSDEWGYIRNITTDGQPIDFVSPAQVHVFDIFDRWLVFTKPYIHNPMAYNMYTGQMVAVSNRDWVSYVWVHSLMPDGHITVYASNHRNPNETLAFSID